MRPDPIEVNQYVVGEVEERLLSGATGVSTGESNDRQASCLFCVPDDSRLWRRVNILGGGCHWFRCASSGNYMVKGRPLRHCG